MQKWPPVYDAGYHPEPGQAYWFPDIEMMEPGSLERTEFKAKRIVDKRDLYDRITHKGFR